MTVATKTIPNYTTQSAAQYKANIDGAVSVHDVVAGAFAAHEMDVGSPAPDLTVRIDAGRIRYNTAVLEVAAQTVTGFTVPSAGQERYDRVVIDTQTGVASRIAGTASTGSPSAGLPDIPGAGYAPCCYVRLTSSTAVITNSMIVDERPSASLIWTPFASAADNLVIGGDFASNGWQRGTSFTSPADSSLTADMWRVYRSAGGDFIVGQYAIAPAIALSEVYAPYGMLVDVSSADASIAAGDVYGVYTTIEGDRFRRGAQQSMVLRFLHKHTKTGTYCFSLRNSGNDRSYVGEYTQAVSNAWELTTAIIPASPSGGTWDYGTGIGLTLTFVIACGSTYQTTAGAWQTGNYLATSNQVNGMDSTSNDFQINMVDLRPGSCVLPVAFSSAAETFALATRYVWRATTTQLSNGNSSMAGGAYSSTLAIVQLEYPQVMRAVPSTSQSSPSGTIVESGATRAWSTMTIYPGTKSAELDIDTASLTAGAGVTARMSSGWFTFTAEL